MHSHSSAEELGVLLTVCCIVGQTKAGGSDNVAADGEQSKARDEHKTKVDVGGSEKKPCMKVELKRLQFYGAGPKAAIPDISDSGHYYNHYTTS